MAYRYDRVNRLEPTHVFTDLGRALSAEVADPYWFLGRQWQLGEQQGEDAASPIRVDYRVQLTPIDPFDGDPNLNPLNTPAEAIVESAPDDFWTPGRRVAIGQAVATAADGTGQPLPADADLSLADLPSPYDVLDGTGPDGRVLFERRADLGLDDGWFPEAPPDPPARDLWNPAELAHDADFSAGGATLRLRRHDGGELDWFSVDATSAVDEQDPAAVADWALATRLTYPGSPNPRWWEIEQAAADLGGYASDRSHFATLLLLETMMAHGDDWFTFPIPGRAGHVATIREARVRDSFDDDWTLTPPTDGWTLFAVAGLDATSLAVWPTVAAPLVGQVADQVDLGADEDANMLWAVERRAAGHDMPSPERPQPPVPGNRADASEQPAYAYRAGNHIPPFWHPYLIEEVNGRRRLVQGRLADLSGQVAALTPAPRSDLLLDPVSGGVHPVHQIEPAAVPVDGLQLERRHVLGRRTDASPVLWTQRRRLPLAAPPVMHLEHDVADLA
jgi:hypothetical protein